MSALTDLIARLEPLAARSAPSENEEFNACDFAAGNFDDAFTMGQSDGETLLAREILEVLRPLA